MILRALNENIGGDASVRWIMEQKILKVGSMAFNPFKEKGKSFKSKKQSTDEPSTELCPHRGKSLLF